MLYNAGQCFTDSRNLHSPHETHSHQKGFFGFGDSRNPLLQMGLMDGAVAERLDSRVGNLTARVDACNSPPLLAPAFFTAPFRRHRHRILFPTTRPPHVRWVTCPYVNLFPVLHETTLGGNSNLLLAFLLSHEDLSSQQLRFTCNISFPFRERCLGDSPSKNDFNTRSCTSNLSSNCVSRLSSHHFFVNKTTDKVCLKPYLCPQCVTILILRCKSMHARRERVGFILRPLAPCFHLGPPPGSLAP